MAKLNPQRVNPITLGVDDLARSRKFYQALGWRSAIETRPGRAPGACGRTCAVKTMLDHYGWKRYENLAKNCSPSRRKSVVVTSSVPNSVSIRSKLLELLL